MPTAKKKPYPKRKPPKKPVQKKEEIEKHLKAINAALGIDDSSPEAQEMAQVADKVAVSEEQTTEAAHASDLVGTPTEEAPEEAATPAEETPETTPAAETSAQSIQTPMSGASIQAPETPAPTSESTPEPTPAAPIQPGESPVSVIPAADANEPVVPVQSGMGGMPEMPTTPGETPAVPGAVPGAPTEQPSLADFGPTGDAPSEGGSKKKKFIIIVLIILVIAALGGGGVYFYNMMAAKQKATQATQKQQAQNEFKVESTPTPTSAPLGNLSSYTVQVLNGSGTAGAAGKAEGLLKTEGFTDITTGNADQYSYTDTEVSLKKGAPAALYGKVKDALGSAYIVTQSADELDSSSDYDVQVIVGSSTPTATETPAANQDQ